MLTKHILNDSFGIEESYIIDNRLSEFNSSIKNLAFCKKIDRTKYTVLFTCSNPDVYEIVWNDIMKFFSNDCVIRIFEIQLTEKMQHTRGGYKTQHGTNCGKYSYGPLCDHWLVDSVGAFCSFASGSDVVENHPIHYISTHLFMYYGGNSDTIHGAIWDDLRGEQGHFDGITPKGDNYRLSKIRIGNDVWLGRNVTITNSANIGNGVIAGAGAVITKDVPDYAVVVGVPARIIRFRYTMEEIEALNSIAWWDWPDYKIKENYDDFYLNIKDFIRKYGS